ncbi:hypothetical protein D3C71_1446260 [compost metagenome]
MQTITLAQLSSKVRPILTSDESALLTVEIIPVSISSIHRGIKYVFSYLSDVGGNKRGQFSVTTTEDGAIENIDDLPSKLSKKNREHIAELTKLFDVRVPNPFTDIQAKVEDV